MDCTVVGIDVVAMILFVVLGDLPSVAILRIFRIVKIAKAYRVMRAFPELHLIVRGLAGAANSIFWGILLTIIVLVIYAILAVQFIHPLNLEVARMGGYDDCERCSRAFESVAQAFLTFMQQTVCGDAWGEVSIPIIELYPLAGAYFMLVFISVQIAVLNLILAATVDAATEARKGSEHEMAAVKEMEYKRAKKHLLRMCGEIDTDKDGRLTLAELIEGFKHKESLHDALAVLELRKADLPMLFSILDVDEGGDVDYAEFVDELHKMKSHDTQATLVFIRFCVAEIRKRLSGQLSFLQKDLYSKLDKIESDFAVSKASVNADTVNNLAEEPWTPDSEPPVQIQPSEPPIQPSYIGISTPDSLSLDRSWSLLNQLNALKSQLASDMQALSLKLDRCMNEQNEQTAMRYGQSYEGPVREGLSSCNGGRVDGEEWPPSSEDKQLSQTGGHLSPGAPLPPPASSEVSKPSEPVRRKKRPMYHH
eukprot:gnl/TRDRNA2_/TRDRNA2_175799_c0_seq2.p1 gnl/TRDRNA2_/TRDRNA2_175799_c0~~gnl/TRDRNA2_/TRDRNA2_175799_c0_seq2.p1  ORF type:complete len:479 (+),score=84.13 gnl/TRDRNA2_/TRDRNA2_175799_c0_seq2:382-1818(+)